jgi:hypothetical protein
MVALWEGRLRRVQSACDAEMALTDRAAAAAELGVRCWETPAMALSMLSGDWHDHTMLPDGRLLMIRSASQRAACLLWLWKPVVCDVFWSRCSRWVYLLCRMMILSSLHFCKREGDHRIESNAKGPWLFSFLLVRSFFFFFLDKKQIYWLAAWCRNKGEGVTQ